MIIDAQSVKNADPTALKGYDAGKKVSGIKRHIAVDTQGLLPGLDQDEPFARVLAIAPEGWLALPIETPV